VIRRLQLRFTSPTAYVAEVICDQFPTDPILVKRGKLPLFVNKTPGYSGIIWGVEPSGIELELWGRYRTIGVIDHETRSSALFKPHQLQPETSCSGYSQICCQSETQQGLGEVNSQVNDCPQSCFSACRSRPVVLSFTTDPFFEQSTRTLTLARGETVTFSFVTSSTEKLPPMVTIEFGDGQQESVNTFSGQISHVYECQSVQCSYTATIAAQDQNAVVSAVTPLTKMTILIQ
jgi:hypothetical protein